MTYRELWRTLEPLYGNGEARAITDYVLDVCFGLSKADIPCGAVEEMTAEKTAELNKIFGRLTEGASLCSMCSGVPNSAAGGLMCAPACSYPAPRPRSFARG